MRLVTFFSVMVVGAAAFAAGTASHTVTVDVQAINEVGIADGNVALTINSATAGSDPDGVSDATTSLDWTTNESSKKITVETSVAAPSFALTVEATTVSGGTSAGVVTLATTGALDFVTGISTTTGGATLSYSASATAANGTGTDTHTITYTITAGS